MSKPMEIILFVLVCLNFILTLINFIRGRDM